MELDPIKSVKIEQKIVFEKQQEFKMIGRTIHKKGMVLFAYDTDKNEVYKVNIEKKKTISYTKTKGSHLRAYVNPAHPMLWAINQKNAARKFKKNLK